MGVTGLWRLIEPSGKPVPLETLENKVLAVDVSIWLHQAIKGFQDAQGAPLPNAHLLGIYHRVCKLLYFRVKPIFVFDGGVPNLKKETIAKRYQQKTKKLSEADRIQKQLLTTLLKHSAVSKVLSEKAKATLGTKPNLSKLASKQNVEDIYKLPPTDFDSTLSSDDETSESVDSSPTKHWDLHTIDEKSEHFKSLPPDVRHEILTELKETRKQSSWGRLHELPKQSDDFSGFQMKRLLKRYSVQVSLEEAEKEMGGRSLSLAELEALLKDQGVDTSSNSLGSHIASDENTRYLLIKDVKTAMVEASKRKSPILESIAEEDESKRENNELKCIGEPKEQVENSTVKSVETCDSNIQTDDAEKVMNIPDSEFQRDLEKAIQLSLQDIPSTSKESNSTSSKKHNFSFLEDFDDADFRSSSESEDDSCQPKKMNKILASAKSYMVEYSGLTPSEIAKIIGNNVKSANKIETNGVSKIPSLENLNSKSVSIVIESNKVDSSTSNKECTRILEYQKATNEDNDDGTVSSSTTKSLQLQHVGTSVSVDTNQVSSSTTKDKVSEASNKVLTDGTKAGENNESDIELIEVMSNASSHSSDDFQEVCEEDNKGNDSKKFEILIKPEDTLEDDIFNDIFCDKKDENSISTSRIDNATIAQSQQNKPMSEAPEMVMEQVTTSDGSAKIVEPYNNKLTEESTNTSSTSENVTKKDNKHTSEHSELTENVLQSLMDNSNKPDSSAQLQEVEKQIITSEQLKEMEQNLILEEAELVSERSSKERMANSLTDQIYQEAQELLQLFGVPYITAPMEAEAQCAFLDDISVTDGTITDDSDIWLFGGKTVYKNFFNQHKHVMEFRAENIQHNFKLSREQMILLALLVGSDYTVGIQGIGPVTALEVLAAFPPSKNIDQQLISGLAEFRRWLTGERTMGLGRTTLRNKLKNVTLSESFPSLQVVKAYLEPTVDTSREPFTWAKPDMQALIEFARKKFGWNRVKSEEILKPVFKRLDETRIQRTIKDYFQTKHKIDSGEAEKKMSKRVKRAVNKIDKGEPHSADEAKQKSKPQKRRKKANEGCETNKIKKKGDVKTKKPQKQNTKDKLGKTTENVTAIESIPETAGLSSDEDIQIFKKTHTESKQKLKQIHTEIKNELESDVPKKPRTIASLHKKEVIPQKEQDKVNVLRSKMKAIEVFRKSKKGPGYVGKRKVAAKPLKEDAELSESSSD